MPNLTSNLGPYSSLPTVSQGGDWEHAGLKPSVLVNNRRSPNDSLITHSLHQCFGGRLLMLILEPSENRLCLLPPADEQSLLLCYAFMDCLLSFPQDQELLGGRNPVSWVFHMTFRT